MGGIVGRSRTQSKGHNMEYRPNADIALMSGSDKVELNLRFLLYLFCEDGEQRTYPKAQNGYFTVKLNYWK